jgi:hypothetical protein
MKKVEKTPLAIIYDKQTGKVVLSHRAVVLDKNQQIPRKELLAEAKKLAAIGKLPLPKKWGCILLEMTRKEIGTLIAIDTSTQKPKFWDIRTRGGSVMK